MNRFVVRKVAVLGAGVMGAQIAAHLVNVKVPVVLFDLASKEGPKNGIVLKALAVLKQLKPSPKGTRPHRVSSAVPGASAALVEGKGDCDMAN